MIRFLPYPGAGSMPRPPRVDEAGGLYHALNRGNLRADIFKKAGDFVALEKLLFEGLQLHQIELFSYQLMSNHYHLVLRPLVDSVMSHSWAELAVIPCAILPFTTPAGRGTFTTGSATAFTVATSPVAKLGRSSQ